MRIDNWGLGRKMELPDHLFGRRFLVSCTVTGGDAAATWDISEIAFPEQIVIWELRMFCDSLGADLASMRMALGDQLPTLTTEMDVLQPLVAGLGLQGAEPRVIHDNYTGQMGWNRLRFAVSTAGRRLVVEATGVEGKTPIVTVGVVVSSVPKEIPEWMFSEPAKKP